MRRVGGDVHGGSGAGRECLAPKSEFKLALKQGEHLLEIVTMRRRSAASRHMHVD